MLPSSTLSFSDLYGPKTPTGQETAPSDTQQASGPKGIAGNEKGPAYTWIALLALLILMRVFYEKLPEGL